jgi:hypothetical protein
MLQKEKTNKVHIYAISYVLTSLLDLFFKTISDYIIFLEEFFFNDFIPILG